MRSFLLGHRHLSGAAAQAPWTVLGFDVDAWTLIGLIGTFLFGLRFAVQWFASERKKASVIPVSFWWISIAGTILQAVYFVHIWDAVGMTGTLPNSLVYLRNLHFIRKHRLAAAGGPPAGPEGTR